MAEDLGQALGWDDEGQVVDGKDFDVLPAGEYSFEVTSVKHEHFGGSKNMSACPIAVLQLKCTSEKANGTVFERLYLNSKVLFRISNFFKAAGLIASNTPEGTRMPMSLFEQAVGYSGRCKIKVRKYKKDGNELEANDVDFIVPKPGDANYKAYQPPAQAPTPGYQAQMAPTYQPPMQPTTPGYATPQPTPYQPQVAPTYQPPAQQPATQQPPQQGQWGW